MTSEGVDLQPPRGGLNLAERGQVCVFACHAWQIEVLK